MILQAGKTIFQELKGLVNNKVFPLVAENSTTFPFIVYSRTQLSTQSLTKDLKAYTYYYDVNVVSDKYSDALDVAEEVIIKLNNKIIDGMLFELQNASEEYNEGFIQTLSFQITNNN